MAKLAIGFCLFAVLLMSMSFDVGQGQPGSYYGGRSGGWPGGQGGYPGGQGGYPGGQGGYLVGQGGYPGGYPPQGYPGRRGGK